ncbi:MAG: cyclin-dependent kinase inhibitor 3 family protein [Aphanocapsa lilacina HA4352-LM1]|jgi:hypothetical protein|nr:cyclin-dependent kinase inhibitor 3 family protein [Aphanocapsa lilacina HA4352-LM1]
MVDLELYPPARTSDTDPIRVDFLPEGALGLAGRTGMCFAPGKHCLGKFALWRRDLEKDLDRLRRHYGSNWLVTLVQAHELVELKIPDLLERARAWGLTSRWFPVRDYGTPTSIASTLMLVEDILIANGQGKTVVIHCKGGLGRTGLVAACCLVARGYSHSEAFGIIRRSRPGSIETAEQEAFVHKFARAYAELMGFGALPDLHPPLYHAADARGEWVSSPRYGPLSTRLTAVSALIKPNGQ